MSGFEGRRKPQWPPDKEKKAPVDVTPPEIDQVRWWIQDQGSKQGSCDTRGGGIDLKDADLVQIQQAASGSDGIYLGGKISTIYRVPEEIYSSDKKAYEPKAVCIGPFFYHWRERSHLKSMQFYKWACVNRLIFKHNNDPMDLLRKCLTKMAGLEECVRSCYSESFSSIKSRDFTLMLLLDGCFVLHLLQRHVDSGEKPKVDDLDAAQVVGRLWIWNLVKYDLLLLQNQIPFIVIRSLYDLLKTEDINLVDCAINLFSTFHLCRKQEQPKFYIPVGAVHHLLHLIYLSVLPCPRYCKSSPKPQSTLYWIPSATELKKAGMKFKKKKKERGFLSFLDVKFSDGVMEIPQLKVHDYSISLFRNFIAFEQCYADTQCHVTVYAAFMDFLIKTEEDARLLYLNDILINSITVAKDRDATLFFSHLCNEVHYALDTNYLRKLFRDVTEYHDSKWHKWRAEFYRQYFKSPLTILSLVAGAIALFFTIFGTIYKVGSRH
ncbi:UPF0481 protein [Cocos nucifera]|uniref:UPF0481 protein n=1 Tax=Cocos nucifera TaxID=13894 RepID=A0A8K0I1N3_COCNU|nr:UPF0481 protein [Cocos nucifera]